MTCARCYPATLTAHELLLLALYRALTSEQQLELSGQVYRDVHGNDAVLRFRDEGRQLGVEHLPASTLRPFVDAALPRQTSGCHPNPARGGAV